MQADGGATRRCGLAAVAVFVGLVSFGQEPTAANLVTNGDFEYGEAAPAGWDPFFIVHDAGGREARPTFGTTDRDSCVRWAPGEGMNGSRGVCIEMERGVAEGYGQGYFSAPIPIEPNTEYEVAVSVRSDAPNAMVFLKGYAPVQGESREVYSKHKEAHFGRYLEKGPYTFLRFRAHPRHGTYAVEYVRVWIYAYLRPGHVWFDDVSLSRVGSATIADPPRAPGAPAAPLAPPEPHPPIYVR